MCHSEVRGETVFYNRFELEKIAKYPLQTEKKYSQGGLEDDLLLLLYVKWYSGKPRTTHEEARLVNPAKYTSEHAQPLVSSLARLCQDGLARSMGKDSCEISDQGRVAVLRLVELPGGFDRLREIQDKLLKAGEGTTDRRSPGKTLVTSNDPKQQPSAASMAASIETQIFETLHSGAEPRLNFGEAISEARTAKKLGVCKHLKTLQKDGNIYCADCGVRIPQVVELK